MDGYLIEDWTAHVVRWDSWCDRVEAHHRKDDECAHTATVLVTPNALQCVREKRFEQLHLHPQTQKAENPAAADVNDTAELGRQWKPQAPEHGKCRGLRPGLLILCGHDCGSGGGFDRGFAAEDGSGDESNDKADGQGLHEGVGHVDEGVLVELLRALYGSDLRGGGGGVKSGGLDLVNLRGEVAVHEVGHEVEVEDLPHGDVADGGDEGDQDAAGEGAAERDLAGEGVVAVAADAEVY